MGAIIPAFLFMAAPGGGASGGGGFESVLPTILLFGGMILIMYFLMIRPQQKKQKQHQQMLENIQRGNKVITNAGIHGTVTDIDGPTLTVQIADNVKVKFEKSAIANVIK